MALIVSAASKGLIRETMEDFVYPPPGMTYRTSDDPFLAMVADGVAGSPDGEVASRLAVESFVDEFNQLFSAGEEIHLSVDMLAILFDRVNRRLLEVNSKMATTLTVGVFAQDRAFILWAGDSPAYMFRSGRLKRLTEPHMVGAWVTAEDGNPVLSTILYSCLGGGTSGFEVSGLSVGVRPGDIFLFMSDGVPLHIGEYELVQLLNDMDLESAIDKIGSLVMERGAYDNYSIVGVKLS
jgi:protein phosphatase